MTRRARLRRTIAWGSWLAASISASYVAGATIQHTGAALAVAFGASGALALIAGAIAHR